MDRDIVCFSHLRWDFVYQRPNHLMARAAANRRVFYVEEPRLADPARPPASPAPHLEMRTSGGVRIVTPVLPDASLDDAATTAVLARLVDGLLAAEGVDRPILWYYTPMALPWTRHLAATARIYDCMDFLAGFRGAPAGLLALDEELVHRADLVFTGGVRLHERMAGRHRRAHCFPSSVDADHFRAARRSIAEPAAMAGLGRPRIGYAGVIDERVDLDLIAGVAAARPAWEVVLVGPVAKIDPATVPAGPNLHAPGMVAYDALPAWLGAWDIGWMPFAHNEATRYISPTKTPEYLAAGLRVVSTGIRDVADPYGRLGLVEIADDVDGTVRAMERLLAADPAAHLARADAFLATMSWDRTWAAMAALLADLEARARVAVHPGARQGHPSSERRAAVRLPMATPGVGAAGEPA